MTQYKMKDFIEETGFDATLVRAVVKELGGWHSDTFSSLNDCARYGADAGFSGFTYYADTTRFFKTHRQAIIAMAENTARELGESMLSMIASFNCLSGAKRIPLYSEDEIARAIYTGKGEGVTSIENALAWFTLEEVSRAFSDWQDCQH